MPFAVRISGFSGQIPRVEPRLLAPNAAQVSENVILTAGRLDPMYAPSQVASAVSQIAQSIYRMFSGATDYWLSWDTDTDVAKTPLAGDTTYRIGYTSAAIEPRQTNLAMAVATPPFPTQGFVLGVTPPITAPTVTSSGGSGTSTEDRYYINTFVTQWGEESAPSPPSAVATGYGNGTWAVSAMDAGPANAGNISAVSYAAGVVTITLNTVFGLRAGEYVAFSGVVGMTSLNAQFKVLSVNPSTSQVTVALTTSQTYTSGGSWNRLAPHNITGMTRRIYRTSVGSASTSFLFVAEIAITSTSYSDTVPTANLAEPCPSIYWNMPPVDMRGIATLPNGFLVGFSGNTLCFSDPYHMFAWPTANQQTTDYPIVGVGIFGQSIVVCTTGTPYIATGIDPTAMSMERVPQPWPCVSKRGIVSMDGSVCYPTNMGLASIGVNGAALLTENMFAQRDWSAMNPSSFISAQYDGQYFAAYTIAGVTKIMMVSPSTNVSTLNQAVTSMYSDATTGILYGAVGGNIYNMVPSSGVKLPMAWTSKEFVTQTLLNISAAQVNAAYTMTPAQALNLVAVNAAISASNAALFLAGLPNYVGAAPVGVLPINGDGRKPLQATDSSSMTLYANGPSGQVVYSYNLGSSNTFKLPSIGKYDSFYIGITGTFSVKDIVIGESVEAMKAV